MSAEWMTFFLYFLGGRALGEGCSLVAVVKAIKTRKRFIRIPCRHQNPSHEPSSHIRSTFQALMFTCIQYVMNINILVSCTHQAAQTAKCIYLF